jgi:hypothetical protein
MARLGEGAGAGGRLGSRESIFKISHTKVREKVQNPDLRSDLARAHLQMARWVYEGGRAERAGRAGQRAGWRRRVASPAGGAPPPVPGRRPGADPRPPPAPPPPTPGPRTEDLQASRAPQDFPGAPRSPGLPLGEAWEVVRLNWARFLAASRFLKFPILNRKKKFRTWTLGPIWRARQCIWPGGSMKGAERAPKASGPMALGEDVRATPGHLSRRSESC